MQLLLETVTTLTLQCCWKAVNITYTSYLVSQKLPELLSIKALLARVLPSKLKYFSDILCDH